jgi:pimeloyl-ACP methyl ester carboxylesterase
VAVLIARSRTFHLPSGRIEAELSGSDQGSLVVGVPGLSANLRSFDAIFAGLDPGRFQCLAFDPRGRGRSERTAAGTYGWEAHAHDIAAMADELGAESLDLVGWSMGAWVAMKVCEMHPGRVRRLVLIDAAGIPEEASLVPVHAGLERLGTSYSSREEFMTLIRAVPVYDMGLGWEAYWEYELEDTEEGARIRTMPDGPREDERYRLTQDPFALWRAVTMPSLLVRASREILPGMGYILSAADAARYESEVAGTTVVEVDANHYNVGMHPDTVRAVSAFLER